MGATQQDIAMALGLDVSSVNKILSRKRGPKFRARTVADVFAAAKRMDYDFGKPRKGELVAFMREMLPYDQSDRSIAEMRQMSIAKVRRFRAMLNRVDSA